MSVLALVFTAMLQETRTPGAPTSSAAYVVPRASRCTTYRPESVPQLARSGCPDRAVGEFWSSSHLTPQQQRMQTSLTRVTKSLQDNYPQTVLTRAMPEAAVVN
eukprot:COSAG02_NODE_4340_length_5485_cov_2.496101_4_plen_104_part_00